MKPVLANSVTAWAARGRIFEEIENAEWESGDYESSSSQHPVKLADGRRGRIDIRLEEIDGSFSIIEVKATDWDAMAEYRVRPNALRHCRQVMKYVFPYWERGIDVCPGLVYPRAPDLADRKETVEAILEDRCIQVVWAEERLNQTNGSVPVKIFENEVSLSGMGKAEGPL